MNPTYISAFRNSLSNVGLRLCPLTQEIRMLCAQLGRFGRVIRDGIEASLVISVHANLTVAWFEDYARVHLNSWQQSKLNSTIRDQALCSSLGFVLEFHIFLQPLVHEHETRAQVYLHPYILLRLHAC